MATLATLVIIAAGTAYTIYSSQQQAAAQAEANEQAARAAEQQAEQNRRAASYQAALQENEAIQRQHEAELADRSAAINAALAYREAGIAEEAAARDAAVMTAQAEYSRDASRDRIRDIRRERDITTGAGRALLGASGVSTEGSPLLALMDLENEFDLEVSRETIRGARERDAILDEASLITADGRLRAEAARAEATRLRFAGDVARQQGEYLSGATRSAAALTRYGGEVRAAGLLSQANAYRYAGDVARMTGTQRSIGAGISMPGTILSSPDARRAVGDAGRAFSRLMTPSRPYGSYYSTGSGWT